MKDNQGQDYFESNELSEYGSKIRKESFELIKKMIREFSPIQVGEDVDACYPGEIVKMRVTKVQLCTVKSWGNAPGNELSFRYEGVLLSKKNQPMKNRLPVEIYKFIKNGTTYKCPSYSRLEIIPAVMYHTRGELWK